jgi:hypothetical protein
VVSTALLVSRWLAPLASRSGAVEDRIATVEDRINPASGLSATRCADPVRQDVFSPLLVITSGEPGSAAHMVYYNVDVCPWRVRSAAPLRVGTGPAGPAGSAGSAGRNMGRKCGIGGGDAGR